MAEHILETRIQLRYATYTRWMNSDIILKRGEAAIATFPRANIIDNLSNSEPDNTPPAIGIKIGDGTHYFSELPWVQAVAADVYNWAKASYKPTYTAQEIQGLQNFVESIAGTGTGGGTVVPRVYQIIQGENEDLYKYYLRYSEDPSSGSWTVDTSTYVDLTDVQTLLEWIGNYSLENYASLTYKTNAQITYYLDLLNYTDSAQTNQFITSVSQESGLISVTRAQPTFSNISGILPVSQGGTGRTSFNEGEVLVGHYDGNLTTLGIATEIASNNKLVTNALIKAYVDNATANLEGAMHFIGEASVEPKGRTNPRVPDYNFSQAQPGDVVLYDTKEFVWTGMNWHLLGDEGSYAIKGSIVNADIADEANISQSKIYGLEDALQNKVNKVEGKQLSTNDYTNEEKSKLNLIEERAQVNIIEHILLNGVEQIPKTIDSVPKTVNLQVLEFDTASQTKLEGIATGAQVNVIEAISLNGVNQPPEEKRVNLVVKEFDDSSREKLTGIAAGAQVNVIESIFVNNQEITPVNKRIDLTTITTEQATKLAGIATGAQVNVIEKVTINNVEMPITAATKTVELVTGLTPYANKIETIKLNGVELTIDQNKAVNILADVNKIEQIKMDGVLVDPTPNTKIIELQSNPAYENKIETIKQLTNNTTRDLEIINKAVTIEADVNKIEEIALNGTVLDISNKRVNIEVRGFTSAEIEKLEHIESGAQVNKIEKIFYGTSLATADELVPNNNKYVLVPSHPEYENTIEHIVYNNEELTISNKTITLPETSVNKIEQIYLNDVRVNPDSYRRVYLYPEVPRIQHIQINGVEQTPDDKTVNIIFNQASLHLDVLEGAQIPGANGTTEEVTQVAKKLQLARIAVTGDVQDLSQTNDTYIILDCGSSTTVI